MSDAALLRRLDAHLSPEACQDLLVALVQAPSPQTALLEAEPALRAFIGTIVAPRIVALSPVACRTDGMGNLLARFGPDTGPSLAFIMHAMNHPPSDMADPYGGTVLDGAPFELTGPVVRGRGASEQKGTMAAMLLAAEALVRSGIALRGTLHLVCCVSGETGKVDAIRNVVEVEGVRPEMAFLYGNGLAAQLGNRGRLDMEIVVHGTACHSSRPHEGCNAITGALEIARRLTALQFEAEHPDLGRAALTLNGLRSTPDATHTVQSTCTISVDRRLLPGENPADAGDVIEAIAMSLDGQPDPASGRPFRIECRRGAFMHPSLVGPDAPPVRALMRACTAVLGAAPKPFYAQSAFDQGYLNHVGVPTMNFGPGEQALAHTPNDVASVDRVFAAARVYALLAAQQLGAPHDQ